MNPMVRRSRDSDVEALVELTLLAFVPVFDSFRELLGPAIYPIIWPDWKKAQREAVETLCSSSNDSIMLVAEVNGAPIGYVAYGIRSKDNEGEVLLLAVHPEHQDRGIGTLLNGRALEEMKAAGVKLAIAETGGESSHAPARRSYEKSGYVGLPLVRYFKSL